MMRGTGFIIALAAGAVALAVCGPVAAKKGKDDLQEIANSGSSPGGSGTSNGTSDDRTRHDNSSSGRSDDSTATRRDGDSVGSDVARISTTSDRTPPGYGSGRLPGDRF